MSSFHKFLQEISTQYSKTPKILYTDNALEFVQTILKDLCISCDILYQIMSPHTFKYNGVVESKHRHLRGMTCTLLVEMGVSHFLWSDALLTSTYLMNRLPLSPLGGEVPPSSYPPWSWPLCIASLAIWLCGLRSWSHS